jgi:DNA repair exonuclease SbcCD nuclease subunit
MRAVVTADLHFSLYGQDNTMENGLHERLYYIDKVFRSSILKYAIDNNIENCIVAGDIFHNKSIIHSKAMATFLDIIRDFPIINFYLIDGNHDHSKLSGDDVTSLKALENEKNVKVVHSATVIENIYMVPWNNKLIDNIKKNPKEAEFLISHFGLNEGQLNSGISIISDIGIKALSHYKYVILGHYHKPQFIENEKTQLYYVGSPIQLDMGERNEEKRFLDIDFEKHEIKSIPTDGYKRFIKFEIKESSDNDEKIIQEINDLKNKGHEVIVEIKDNSFNTDKLSENVRIVNKVDVDITNRGISLDMDDIEKFKTYLQIKDIPENKHDDYLQMATEIINISQN